MRVSKFEIWVSKFKKACLLSKILKKHYFIPIIFIGAERSCDCKKNSEIIINTKFFIILDNVIENPFVLFG